MSTKTENYSFTKPDETDFYNINVYNANVEELDAILKQIVDLVGNGSDNTEVLNAIAEVKNNLGASSDNANSLTAFGVINTIHTLVQQLRNVITDTRASKLDNLDAKLSDLATSTALASVKSVVDNINTNAARMTAARATIIDNIGATTNTGGTSSAGTLNAKVNACISSLTSLANAVSAVQTKVNSMPSTFIKSVQRGTYNNTSLSCSTENDNGYVDIAINAVDMNKTIVIVNSSSKSDNMGGMPNGKLINATTLRLYSSYWYNGTGQFKNYNWQIVEFY